MPTSGSVCPIEAGCAYRFAVGNAGSMVRDADGTEQLARYTRHRPVGISQRSARNSAPHRGGAARLGPLARIRALARSSGRASFRQLANFCRIGPLVYSTCLLDLCTRITLASAELAHAQNSRGAAGGFTTSSKSLGFNHRTFMSARMAITVLLSIHGQSLAHSRTAYVCWSESKILCPAGYNGDNVTFFACNSGGHPRFNPDFVCYSMCGAPHGTLCKIVFTGSLRGSVGSSCGYQAGQVECFE